ncbi:MAG: YbhB/YbcL family Raf kinase inhibitor-like protein [Candidatus Babeliales bacterium]
MKSIFILISFLTQGAAMALTLSSPAFTHKGNIPAQYTCDGTNISPALQWSGGPASTKSFALIVDDPDAPSKTYVHWVVFNISATTTELAEGVRSVTCGTNDFGTTKYGGPCPPSGTHRYHFKLYALDTMLDLSSDATKEDVLDAMQGHVLAQTELVGLYARTRNK